MHDAFSARNAASNLLEVVVDKEVTNENSKKVEG
jgi:hypothetical protein